MNSMRANAKIASDFLKGIANPHRLLILCELATGEKSVSALIAATGMSQTSMSQHLSKLKKEQIVSFRRQHRLLFYRIENETALKMMTILHDTFCEKKEINK